MNPKDYDEYNTLNDHQGAFRVGHLDLVALKYALNAIGGVDKIALTHMDRASSKVCVEYSSGEIPKEDGAGAPSFDFQHNLAKTLFRSLPIYSPMDSAFEHVSVIHPNIGYLSYGPTLADKQEYPR